MVELSHHSHLKVDSVRVMILLIRLATFLFNFGLYLIAGMVISLAISLFNESGDDAVIVLVRGAVLSLAVFIARNLK